MIAQKNLFKTQQEVLELVLSRLSDILSLNVASRQCFHAAGTKMKPNKPSRIALMTGHLKKLTIQQLNKPNKVLCIARYSI